MARYRIVNAQRFQELKALARSDYDLRLVQALPAHHAGELLRLLPASKAQLRQDLVALSLLDMKRGGFFVEFGATDGVGLSNTHLLETKFGWTGILAEPDARWHTALKANRTCRIDTRCVAARSGETARFTVARRGENSGISSHLMLGRRARGRVTEVETVSLNDLLQEHGAPERIDYLSIDTEGSEALILEAFDLDRWQIGVVTVEHNFQPQRARIEAVMTRHGFRRVHEALSRFDDWYVHPDLTGG
jgi:FkbM family methyltransferase